MVDKEPGQIEQTTEPGYYRDYMKCLNPEHANLPLYLPPITLKRGEQKLSQLLLQVLMKTGNGIEVCILGVEFTLFIAILVSACKILRPDSRERSGLDLFRYR
jgi:hypothetical protein